MSSDWYDILGISDDATEKEIARAFRKQSLKYHPDKNPSKEAEEKFHILSKALEVLTTPKLKEDFDRARRAEVEHKKRREKLDSQRRKLQQDLERREQLAESGKINEAKRKLEILKMEGLKRRKAHEEKEKKIGEVLKERVENVGDQDSQRKRRVKVKFFLPGPSKQQVESMFSRFGKIDTVVLVEKNGLLTALLEFVSLTAALACKAEDFTKLAQWEPEFRSVKKVGGSDDKSSSGAQTPASSNDMSDQEYQATTLMRLRKVAMEKGQGAELTTARTSDHLNFT